MFQFSLAVEGHVAGKAVTLAVGVGMAAFGGMPWYRHVLSLVAQAAPGVRRYGLIVCGCFVTGQFVDIDGARAALVGEQIRRKSTQSGKKIRAGVA